MGQRHRHFQLAQPRRVQLEPDTDPQGIVARWLQPDFQMVYVWPFGLLDYGSATLRCKITLAQSKEREGSNFAIWQPCLPWGSVSGASCTRRGCARRKCRCRCPMLSPCSASRSARCRINVFPQGFTRGMKLLFLFLWKTTREFFTSRRKLFIIVNHST